MKEKKGINLHINKKNKKKQNKKSIDLKKVIRKKYLISQDETFIQLCLLNLFIKIIFFIHSNDNINRDTN
jgi:hypothetical protein